MRTSRVSGQRSDALPAVPGAEPPPWQTSQMIPTLTMAMAAI